MQQSPFENLQEYAAYFATPQLDDLLQSILVEIKKLRPVNCIIGFHKAGKSSFLHRLESILGCHTILLAISQSHPFSGALSHDPSDPHNITNLLQSKKHVVILIDDAHLLTDQDFAAIMGLLELAQKHGAQLQFVLMGNGEIVHRLARPANRPVYQLLDTLWNLPKLTREQSLEYIAFLLDQAGLSPDLIIHPEAVARRAAGIVGTLRTLTIALAEQALDSRENCDAEKILYPSLPKAEQTDAMATDTARHMDRRAPLPVARIVLGLAFLAGALFWLMAPHHLTERFKSSPPAQEAMLPEAGNATENHSLTSKIQGQTVFRKRTNAGPYSLQLGTYPTVDDLLAQMPRFVGLGQPLLWNHNQQHYALFAGRFDTAAEATSFAAQYALHAPVACLPFVVTVGPLTEERQILLANFLLGLPEKEKIFEQELVSGVEIQFALEPSQDVARTHCFEMEKKGLSCAVTQYE